MRRSGRQLRERGSRAALAVGNMIRRVVVAASQGEAWGLQGYAIPDLRGGDSISLEGEGDEPLEVFQGIGIAARPADGDNAEALVFAVGAEAEHQIFGAMRNEAARARYVEEFGEIAGGEIAIFNSAGSARVLVRADGSIEITSATGKEVLLASSGGTPQALATLADVQAVQSDLDAHEHFYIPTSGTPGSPVATTLGPTVTAPSGTSVVKGE